MNDDQDLINSLIRSEAIKRFAYQDIYGYWTVGIGRCIDQRKGVGLSIDECMYLLQNDINRCRQELSKFPWFNIQDKVRQEVLIELCFNMGLDGLLGFKDMIAHLQNKDYVKAGEELMDSKWAKKDVGKERSSGIKYRLVTGKYAKK